VPVLMNIDNRISRRLFLALSGGASLVPPVAWAAGDVPLLLDHVLLGCADLDRSIDFVAQAVGVRAAFGGVHPGRGTRNALLALGERRYLEIIAPDPKQDGIEGFAQKQVAHLKQLASPHLIGWAAHPDDLEKFSVRLREAGIAFDGPRAGSRQRPDGKLLQWKTLNLKDDRDGLLPFFIEWSADSLHPSEDAPKLCRLTNFGGLTPNTDELAKIASLLQLDLSFSRGDQSALRATIVGPKGELKLTS
jgi:catechol 2,3-dioxygenase-like lactoylglutathione lyase family enzyme